MVELLALIAAAWQSLVDRVSESTKWTQHGTVLTDWYDTRTDSALLLVAGQQLLGQVLVFPGLCTGQVMSRESDQNRVTRPDS